MPKLRVKDLKPAKYNPRSISTDRLNKLAQSISEFGDLSGVVFNEKTNTVVSGHQRLKTIGKKNSTIITEKHKDEFGTVALGYVEVEEKTGKIKIPFRVVRWDARKEKLANIAANAQGGDFDDDKLAKLLAELELDQFSIELSGFDPITVSELVKMHKAKTDTSEPDEDFEQISPDGLGADSMCVCPRCNFQFDLKAKKKK